jgi:hypothetical protein
MPRHGARMLPFQLIKSLENELATRRYIAELETKLKAMEVTLTPRMGAMLAVVLAMQAVVAALKVL